MSAPSETTREISVTAANRAALAYADLFRRAGVQLPLEEAGGGVVVDGTGRTVFVVDPDRNRWNDDADADRIAQAILLAVNGLAAGGAS